MTGRLARQRLHRGVTDLLRLPQLPGFDARLPTSPSAPARRSAKCGGWGLSCLLSTPGETFATLSLIFVGIVVFASDIRADPLLGIQNATPDDGIVVDIPVISDDFELTFCPNRYSANSAQLVVCNQEELQTLSPQELPQNPEVARHPHKDLN
jgi:hypothetical protein